MVRIADRANLFETVCDNFRRREQGGIDFVFVRIIRADGRDKRPGSNVFFVNKKFCRRRAGDNDVAASDRTRQTATGSMSIAKFARKLCSETQRGV